MKAKRIHEEIGFKRGKDPHKALDIGEDINIILNIIKKMSGDKIPESRYSIGETDNTFTIGQLPTHFHELKENRKKFSNQ